MNDFWMAIAAGFLIQVFIWSNAYYIPYYIAKGWRKGAER